MFGKKKLHKGKPVSTLITYFALFLELKYKKCLICKTFRQNPHSGGHSGNRKTENQRATRKSLLFMLIISTLLDFNNRKCKQLQEFKYRRRRWPPSDVPIGNRAAARH